MLENLTSGIDKLLPNRLFAASLIFALTLLVLLRFLPTLPTVMQDEYVYLSQSLLPLGDSAGFGNFLHSLVYSSVFSLGENFYLAVKIYNAIFLFVFALFAYLTADLFLERRLALLLAGTVPLSATALYASIFTPEMMFFALASGSLYFFSFAIRENFSTSLSKLALSVVFLALSGLTKPHAIILGLGMLFGLLLLLALGRIHRREGFLALTLISLGYPAIKLSLGFALAGTSGITVLGRNYEAALMNFFSQLGSFSQGSLSAAGLGAFSSDGFGLATVSSFFLVQLLTLGAALVFMTFGLPIVLARPMAQLSNYQIIVISISVTYLLAIAAFTALVTYSGDDHSNRVLARYFEFLVPFVLIASIIEIAKRSLISKRSWAISLTVLGAFVALWFFVLDSKRFLLADSGILLGAFREEWLPWFVALASLVLIWLAKQRPKALLSWSTILILGATSLVGASSSQRQIEQNSVKTASDFAGLELNENFSGYAGDEIIVLGTNRPLAFVVKFWSLRPGVKHQLVYPGSQIDINDEFLDSYSLVVELPSVQVEGGLVLGEDSGYRIITRNSNN